MNFRKKNYFVISIVCLFLLLVVMLTKTFTLLKQVNNASDYRSYNIYNINENIVVERLSKSLGYKTVSNQDGNIINFTEFNNFYKFLEESFPNVHKSLRKEKINEFGVLYKWEGSKKDCESILLMAHLDVVPAEEKEGNAWKYPPFSGTVCEGYVWGRGALDMKSQLMGQFEAIEELINRGYKPVKTIYLAIGHDEEIGGINGNAIIASYFESKEEKFSLVLDEGGFIVKNMISGINAPVGMVGIAEKGYLTLELSAVDKGGHSSMPPKHTAIGKLANAIKRLEDSPFDAKVDGATKEFIDTIAPELPFMQRLVFANMWLFRPLIIKKLSSLENTNALLRTTMATTMIKGGVKENVLPQQAEALVNFRILPGENIDSVISKVKKIINDEQINIKVVNYSWNPSKISDSKSEEFKGISMAIKKIFPNAIVTPYLVVGSTDSRHYQKLTNNIFRFSPIEVDQEALKTIHGVNERISTSSYIKLINFYCNFIEELQGN